jgi:pectate lyase C
MTRHGAYLHVLAIAFALGCSGEGSTGGWSVAATGGSAVAAGAATGGADGTATGTTGGTAPGTTGGAAPGATGGVATGGTSGTATGGTGGTATGGTGGTATGGTGGRVTGGTGGFATGGTGGFAIGGTGGFATGGTGGVATGGTGGFATGGTETGGTGGSVPDIGPGPCECETPAGEYGSLVSSTIVVGSGQVYDGGCLIYRANPDTLGSGDQSEDQSPVFLVNSGGTLRNVVLGASAADGIHLYGDVTLENIHWLDIGEDAMTVKQSGTVHLNCGSATKGDDKVFQVNAASEIHISNFTAWDAGKFMRQNGDTTFFVDVYIDHCDISSMNECIFRTDSPSSHVTLTNTRYSHLGRGLFIFGSSVVNGDSGQSTVSNNQAY